MTERRVSDNAMGYLTRADLSEEECSISNRVARDLRDSLAREAALRAELATKDAALTAALEENAAAKRRGMERAAGIVSNHAILYRLGKYPNIPGARALEHAAELVRAALPPQTDTASAASEVRHG